MKTRFMLPVPGNPVEFYSVSSFIASPLLGKR
jgi:hypothetical protein